MKFNKTWALSLLITALLCTTITYGLIQAYPYTHHDPKASVNVFVFTETAGGENELTSGNLIPYIGGNYMRDILGFQNVSAPENATKWITLSNDATPLVTWTKLANEKINSGFIRTLGTVAAWMNGTNYAYNVTNKFTATADTQQLQCAGLQWSGVSLSDNNLFACAAFTQTTFNTNDNCTITWVITIAI